VATAGPAEHAPPADFEKHGRVRVPLIAFGTAPHHGPQRAHRQLQGAAGHVRAATQLVATRTGRSKAVSAQWQYLPDGLARAWPPPDSGAQMHQSYALQWYSFAALSVALFVVLSFRRARPNA